MPGNFGCKGVECTIAGHTDEDSDDDAGGGTAYSMDPEIMTLRNELATAKHGVHVKASRGKTDRGSGLFAAKDLAAGHEILVNGPLFKSEQSLTAWIDDQPALTHDFIRSSAHCITYIHDEHISNGK